MNTLPALWLLQSIALSNPIDSLTPRFDAPLSWQAFPDGGVEWQGSLNCPDPAALSGAYLEFGFDFDLDFRLDAKSDSVALSPADCAQGRATFVHTSFPGAPGILRVWLRRANVAQDSVSAWLGAPGSGLRLNRFCASPAPGDPEWIEVRNSGNRPVFLNGIFLQGHSLGAGVLDPGAALVAGPDTSIFAQVFPGLQFRKTAWSYLRNSGDTLRLQALGVTLDSLVYSAGSAGAPDPRDACADGGGVAEPAAYDLHIANARWHIGTGPLNVTVTAPATSAYDLIAYDLEGYPLCALLRKASGPRDFFWDASACPVLFHHLGPVLLQLQPQGGKPIRKVIVARP